MTASQIDDKRFVVRLARDGRDLRAAQRLRYRVFIEELGGSGSMVDHQARLEIDAFDAVFDHLLLIDPTRSADDLADVVGVYRLLRSDKLAPSARFYSEDEFDLTLLRATGRRLMELGRSCVDPDFRGGTAMLLLWNAVAEYVLKNDVEIMFGPASFHGTDLEALAQPLSYLHHNHLAPLDLRVSARAASRVAMDTLTPALVDKRAAVAAIPALIKAYLRLGGYVGDGAWVDHTFNTTDVCVVMDTHAMSARHRAFYTRA
jgi:putative hemolysin